MKTFRTSIFTAIASGLLLLAACSKNNNSSNTPVVASSSSKLSFQLQATNTNLVSTQADTATATVTGLTWTTGTANVGKFAFVAKRAGVSINIQSNNLTNVDLFALTPLQTYVTLDTGTYKEIAITAFLQHSGNDSIPLKLTGSFKNDSAKVVPIEFDLTEDAIVQVKTDNIDINGTTDYTALLDMQLNRVTKGITADDFNKAKLTGGSIMISKSSNTRLYNKMRANISLCGWYQFSRHSRH